MSDQGPDVHTAAWTDAAGWEGAARLRRRQALSLTPAERIAVVEELIMMAIAAGSFRTKLGERFIAAPQ